MFDCFSEQTGPNTCRNVRTVVAVSVSTILVVSIICTVGLYVKPGKTSKGNIIVKGIHAITLENSLNIKNPGYTLIIINTKLLHHIKLLKHEPPFINIYTCPMPHFSCLVCYKPETLN